MVKQAIAPDYALSSHVAPLGMTFSMNSAMPKKFANGAFIGEHGSWNREFFNGYKVVYVPFENGVPAGMAQDVVTGFIEGDQVHGRPVGVGIDGTGALLIADDAGNMVWRVAATDGSITPTPIGTDMSSGEPRQGAAAQSGEPAAQPSPSVAVGQGQPQTAEHTEDITPTPPQTAIAPAVLPKGAEQQNGSQSGQ
jgi:hypothetical protein